MSAVPTLAAGVREATTLSEESGICWLRDPDELAGGWVREGVIKERQRRGPLTRMAPLYVGDGSEARP